VFSGIRRLSLCVAGGTITAGIVACLIGCAADRSAARNPDTAPIEVKDDAGNIVHLARPARRILSLVPSATQTLIAIGATGDLVGRTRYDNAPEVANLPSVGGALDASVESIVHLHPDLVIAWRTESRGLTRERLVSFGIPVFVIETEDTTDIFRGVASLGRLTGRDSAATAVVASVHRELDAVRQTVAGRPSPSVFYVVYTDPPMTAGPRTFIAQLISLAGGRSIYTDSSRLWPNVAMEEIVRRDPDIIVVPVGDSTTTTLDRMRQLTGWRDLRAVRTGHVVTVPDAVVNLPSPAIGKTARVLLAAIHPEIAERAR